MISIDVFRKSVLSFPDVIELPHFHLVSFRIKNKIFATFNEKEIRAMLKLSLIDQSVFCDVGKGAVCPVPGSWGKQGATYFDLKKVNLKLLKDALSCSYKLVAAGRNK